MTGLRFQLALLLLVPLMVAMVYTCPASATLHPLILIPGSGGSQLEARLTSAYRPSSPLCGRWYPPLKDKDGWFRLWFDPSVLVAPFTACFAHRMTLHYDPAADDYCNTAGVETRVSQFGSLNSLLYLDPNLRHITEYMASLVRSLEAMGYVEGETLFGAPYDFRYGLAADGHPSRVGSEYLQNLRGLIEKASGLNGGKRVILLSHSLGGLFALHLLNRNPVSWRKHFVEHLVALSAPWGGTVEEMLTFASGNALGVPLVDPLLVRDEQRSSESNLWMMPSPRAFDPRRPLVVTPGSNYTARDIAAFLRDIGYPEGVGPYEERVLPLVEAGAVPPGVPVTCVIGGGVETPETLVYGTAEGLEGRPDVVYGDGDGTVNAVSLAALEKMWAEEKNQTVRMRRVAGVSHIGILSDEQALNEIMAQIREIHSSQQRSFGACSE